MMFSQFLAFAGVLVVMPCITVIAVFVCKVFIAKADSEKAVNCLHYQREIEQVRAGMFEYEERALPAYREEDES